MIICVDSTAVKFLPQNFIEVTEIVTKHCWARFLGHPYR